MSLPSGLCLVTGATGFVGSAVARALLKAGHPVRVLARPNSDRRNLAGLAVEIAEGSLEEPERLVAAVAGCRYLFHVAADYRLWVPDPAPMFRVNVEGTRELMLAALGAGVERIVYTSSVATLGIVPDGIADEATASRAADMIGPYKLSKFTAEAMVSELILERSLPAVIVNPSTPVGPGDIKPTPTGRRPPALKIPHAAIMAIASGAEAMARLTGREPFATKDGARMSQKKMFFSSARAVDELGYAPRPARQALTDAIAWFKTNGYLR